MFRMYRQPEAEEFTVIAADPADGGADFCAAVAKSKKHKDSFMVFEARMDSSQFGYELAKMAKYIYNRTKHWPVIGVERNVGMATLHVLQTLNYPELFRMPRIGQAAGGDEMEDSRQLGWVTSGGPTGTRKMMLDELHLSLKQRVNVIGDKPTIQQFFRFIVKPNGRPEAARGHHDDLVIAEAIALQLMKYTPSSVMEAIESTMAAFPEQEFDEYGLPK